MTPSSLSAFAGSWPLPFDMSVSILLTKTLVHFAWEGSLIAVVYMVLDSAIKRLSAEVRYFSAVVTLVCLAVCPLVTLCILSTSPASKPITVPSEERKAPTTVITDRNDETKLVQFIDPPLDQIQFASRDSMGLKRETQSTWLTWISPYAAAFYLIGVACMALRLVAGLRSAYLIRITAIEIVDAKIRSLVTHAAKRLAIKIVPLIAYSQNVTVPAVVGIMRPMILLPSSLATGLSMHHLEAILLHELAHIRRCDPMINLCQRIVEAVLFLHPAVWFVSHRINVERENACDDLVLACGWHSSEYVAALLEMAERSIGTQSACQNVEILLAATGSKPSQFRQRVLRLLGEPVPSPLVNGSGLGELVVLAFLLFVTLSLFTFRSENHALIRSSAMVDNQTTALESGNENVDAASPTAILVDNREEEGDSKPAVFAKRILEKIVIEGNRSTPETDIMDRITIHPGEEVTEKQIRITVDALVRTGWFASVQPLLKPTGNGLILTIKLLERPIIRSVGYIGLKRVNQKFLDNLTQLKPGNPFDVSSNYESARRIEEYYHNKGFVFATVELAEGGYSRDRDVAIIIREGPKVELTRRNDVKSEVPFTVMIGSDAPSMTMSEIEAIKHYYHRQGFFEVAIEKIQKVAHYKHYEIHDGRRYQIRNIDIKCEASLGDGKLRDLLKIEKGNDFNGCEIDDAIQRMCKLADLGEKFARVVWNAIPSETEPLVDIEIQFHSSNLPWYEFPILPIEGIDVDTDVDNNGQRGKFDEFELYETIEGADIPLGTRQSIQ